jgi:hypothetical protein
MTKMVHVENLNFVGVPARNSEPCAMDIFKGWAQSSSAVSFFAFFHPSTNIQEGNNTVFSETGQPSLCIKMR